MKIYLIRLHYHDSSAIYCNVFKSEEKALSIAKELERNIDEDPFFTQVIERELVE